MTIFSTVFNFNTTQKSNIRSDIILIVGISHHHQHSCPCLGADLGLREMFVIKSVRYSSALERTLPSPLTSSSDEEAVADGDNYDIADDEEYYVKCQCWCRCI